MPKFDESVGFDVSDLENTITGCQAKNPNPVGFCELLSARTAENDELDGVWDLARAARDVCVWMRWKEHSDGANRPKCEKFLLPVATGAAQITCGYSTNHMFHGSFRRNWSKRV